MYYDFHFLPFYTTRTNFGYCRVGYSYYLAYDKPTGESSTLFCAWRSKSSICSFIRGCRSLRRFVCQSTTKTFAVCAGKEGRNISSHCNTIKRSVVAPSVSSLWGTAPSCCIFPELSKRLSRTNWRTLKEETFAGRNFRDFSFFCPFRESFFREIFQNGPSAKVSSREMFQNGSFPENYLFILHIFWGEGWGGGGDFSSIFSSRVKKIEKLYFWWVVFLKKYSWKRVRNGFTLLHRQVHLMFQRYSIFICRYPNFFVRWFAVIWIAGRYGLRGKIEYSITIRESFFLRNILKSFERESFFPRNAKISRSGPTAKVSSRESFFL